MEEQEQLYTKLSTHFQNVHHSLPMLHIEDTHHALLTRCNIAIMLLQRRNPTYWGGQHDGPRQQESAKV